MDLVTIASASELIRRREASPVELVRECLEKIERLNPVLNAYITVMAESALREAKQAETEIQAGKWRGTLHGIPIGIKDLIDTAGVRTTAGSAAFRDRVPKEDAGVVEKLRLSGAVLIGKHNLHEFAYGGSSLISFFGPVRNPVDPEFIAGGSSGGSAAAVAAGMCYGAIGTDTAGSIREPAALCGVVGLKPSYGLISVQGIIPLSKSLDHAGPIARSVEDAAILLDAVTESRGEYRKSLGQGRRHWRIGVPRKHFFEDLDGEVAARVEDAIDRLAKAAGPVRDVEVAVNFDRTLQAAEAYAYHRERVAASPELYDPETLRRIRTGEGVTADEYQAALAELLRTRAEIGRVFDDVDVLVMPTTPIAAPRISELMEDREKLRPAELVLLRNTRPVNVWGLPAISVPCGFSSGGLPIGLQFVGRRDAEVLQIAREFE